RNIGDEYFDMDPRYNFIDTDLHLRGYSSNSIQKFFDRYWTNGLRTSAPKPVSPARARPDKKIQECLKDNPADQALLAEVKANADKVRARTKPITVKAVTVVSDYPDWHDKTWTVGRKMYEMI